MRLEESDKKVSIEWVMENCSEAIEQYIKGQRLYKGTSDKGDIILRSENKVRRKAANAIFNLHNNIINRSSKFSEFPNREHIGSTFRGKAYGYGDIYAMLPLNGSKVGICPHDDIYFSFQPIRDLGIVAFNQVYRMVLNMCRELDTDHTNLNTQASTNRVFKELHQIYKDMGEDNFIDELEELLEDNDFRTLFKEVLYPAIKENSAKRFIDLFSPEGFKLQKISNLNLGENKEVWTDGDVVLVKNQYLEEYLEENKLTEDANILLEKQLQLPITKDTGHIVILAGSPGAGKSYSLKNFTNVTDNSTTIDVDEYKRLVLNSPKLREELKAWLKKATDDIIYQNITDIELASPNIMKDAEFNNLIHAFISEKGYHYKKLDALGKSETKPNIVIDGTLRFIPSIEAKLKDFYSSGYTTDKTHLVFIYSSLQESLDRNKKRSRSAGEEFLTSAFDDVMRNIMDIIKTKKLPANAKGSFSVIVNRDDTDTSNVKYFKIMENGKWNDNNIRRFISILQSDIKEVQKNRKLP